MPKTGVYGERSGSKPDNLFQMLSKHFGGDGRRFGVQRDVIEARRVWEA